MSTISAISLSSQPETGDLDTYSTAGHVGGGGDVVADIVKSKLTYSDAKKRLIKRKLQNRKVISLPGVGGSDTDLRSDVAKSGTHAVFGIPGLYKHLLGVMHKSKNEQTLGFTNGISIFTGYLTAKQAASELKVAEQFNDTIGIKRGNTNKVRSALEISSGTLSLATTSLAISSVSKQAKVQLASKVLGNISAATAGLYYLSLIIDSSMSLHEARKNSKEFVKAYKQNAPTLEVVNTLKKRLCLDEKEHAKTFDKAIARFHKNPEKAISKMISGSGFEIEDKEYKLIESYVDNLYQTSSSQALCTYSKSCVCAYLISELKKKYAARQQSFVRVYGTKVLQNLYEHSKLSAQESTPENKVVIESLEKDTIELARKNLNKKIFFSTQTIAAVSVLIGLMIAGTIITGGTLALVISILSMATAIITTGIDFYGLFETCKNQKINKKEKIMLVVLSALVMASIVAANIFSGGVVGLVMLSTMGVGLAGTVAYGLYVNKNKVSKESKDKLEKIDDKTPLEELIAEYKAYLKRKQLEKDLREAQDQAAAV